MSKEQIEEMAKIFIEADDKRACWNTPCQKCEFFEVDGELCKACFGTKALYNAGYRKQEWISVIERLPEASGKYIVCTKRGNVYQTKFYSYPENKGGHWGQKDKGRSITHWMPLPEAPRSVCRVH